MYFSLKVWLKHSKNGFYQKKATVIPYFLHLNPIVMKIGIYFIIFLSIFYACKSNSKNESSERKTGANIEVHTNSIQSRLNQYEEVSLTPDLSRLSKNQKKAVDYMIKASKVMDGLFWYESYGNSKELLDSLYWYMAPKNANISDVLNNRYPSEKLFLRINYGPWDRLNNNAVFIPRIGAKPKGANFYPPDMTKKEFEAWANTKKTSPYTFVRRRNDKLENIPYHKMFERQVKNASKLILEAAKYVENESFRKYLKLRAKALLTDQYRESDMAWMDVENNDLEFVVGPIETYEDKLMGYKTSHEAYVLIRDLEWTKKLKKYNKILPKLQKILPVEEKYKKEKPGDDVDLGAYNAIFYAGECNAGSKTMAINLPNDEYVQLKKGSRKIQIKNVMQEKYKHILVPITKLLISEGQQESVNFDAFFANTMFHEIAHGIGIKNTITGKGTVKNALKEYAGAIEEAKADILGLYLISYLIEQKELKGEENEHYTTFLASMLRSVRFGVSSAHGLANIITFNFFTEMGAIKRNQVSGIYSIVPDLFEKALKSLANKLLTLQGNGDYQATKNFILKYNSMPENLQTDLDRLTNQGVPKDIYFKNDF